MKERRKEIYCIAGWSLAALVLFGFYFATTFQSLHRSSDGCGYAAAARSILRGEGCLTGWAPSLNYAGVPIGKIVEPAYGIGVIGSRLWPLILAFFFLFLGAADATVVLASGFFYVLTVPILFIAAGRLFSQRAAHLACALYVFNSLYLSYTLSGITENLFFFLTACFLFFAAGKNDLRSGLGCGLILALAAATRQNGLIWIGPLIVLALARGEKRLTRLFAIAGAFGLFFLFFRFAIDPMTAKKAIPEPRERVGSAWQEEAARIEAGQTASTQKADVLAPRFFLLDWIAKSPLREIILLHSPDFPEHSYPRGMDHPDSAGIVAGNLSAYVKRMEINLVRVVETYLWRMSNPLLMILGWVGIIGFFLTREHRTWSAAVCACLVCGPAPNILTFAWPRYLHPALLLFILSAAGILARLSARIPGTRARIALFVLLVLVCSFPLGFTAGIDALAPGENPGGLLSFLVRNSDPACLQHRLASRDFSDKLTTLLQKQIPPGATLACDIPSVAAWYGDRATVWLPNDEQTLARLLGRVNIDYLVLLFQFERESYEPFWRQWLKERAQNPEGASGLEFIAGVPTDKGAIYLFSTGIEYR